MTMIKMYIASGLIALAVHAAFPSLPTDCAPVTECTQKELIE